MNQSSIQLAIVQVLDNKLDDHHAASVSNVISVTVIYFVSSRHLIELV